MSVQENQKLKAELQRLKSNASLASSDKLTTPPAKRCVASPVQTKAPATNPSTTTPPKTSPPQHGRPSKDKVLNAEEIQNMSEAF